MNDWEFTSLEDLERIRSSFSQNGFVCLRQVPWTTNLMEEWSKWSSDHMTHILDILHQRQVQEQEQEQEKKQEQQPYALSGIGVRHGYREVVMRSPGRYEISIRECSHRPSLEAMESTLLPLLYKLLDESSSSSSSSSSIRNLNLCHISLLVSTPGASDQGWHADGGHIDLTTHLECHCLNVFIPLDDVPLERGPTEFRPSSHYITRKLVPFLLAAKARGTWKPPVLPTLQVKDIILMDYRILHRGRANRTTSDNRIMLVLTYSKPWFRDVVNFPSRSIYSPAEDDN